MKKAYRMSVLPSAPINLGPHSGPLRLVAFSDYRVQDIEVLRDELSKLEPPADVVLYAGDDIRRFRPSFRKNLFEMLACRARYGLCAVAGNDDEPPVRKLISGKSVFNVHSSPVILGSYAFLGVEGAPDRPGLEGIGYILHPEKEIARHLALQKRAAASKTLVILSHAPPEGVLDQAVRFSLDRNPRSIGSRALKTFVQGNKSVALVLCGHVHRCGGMYQRFGCTLIVNVSNHDDYKAVGRFAVIDLEPAGGLNVDWREIREASVVPGIGPSSAERLRRVGIRTVEELAGASPEVIEANLRFSGRSPEVLHARARALVENQLILLRLPELPSGPEVFLDIETDLSQSYIWLVGLCIGRDGRYRSFFAQEPNDEKKILVEFLNLIGCYATANLFSCSGSRFEERVLRSRLSYHRLDTSVCTRIVDLHPIILRSVALPIQSYRVKEIGEFFGYRYKHPDLDGYMVGSLYESKYLGLRKANERRKLARKLREYNQDDVRCLPFVLGAIERLHAQSFENVSPTTELRSIRTSARDIRR